MALHPEVQRLGQTEIDKVIGNNRVPSISDRPSLPFVEAIMREVLRWNPVTNLSALTYPAVVRILTIVVSSRCPSYRDRGGRLLRVHDT